MRIAINCTAAFSQGAGVGRYTRGLVRALTALDQQNQYVLFHPRSKGLSLKSWLSPPGNFKERAVRFSERGLGVFWYHLGIPLPVDLLTGPVDLFHSPDFVLPPVRRGATVVTVHDLSFLLFPECAEEGLRIYLERMVPDSLARADLVLADSAHTENDLICLMDLPPSKVQVVYPAADPWFKPITEEEGLEAVAKKYGLPRPFILTVGTLEPRKNLVRLLQAFALLEKKDALPPKLVIVGREGWKYEEIYRTVTRLGLERQVRFLGYLPEEDLPALYNLATLFVFPSLYEGFGLPPLEAMACGTPVVTSDSASLPEVVGDAGLTVAATDTEALAAAMQRLLEDNQLRESLAKKGIERAKLFSWQRSAEQVLAIYRRLVGEL